MIHTRIWIKTVSTERFEFFSFIIMKSPPLLSIVYDLAFLKHAGSTASSGSAAVTSSRHHVCLRCTAFKDIEAVDEMEHEVGGQRIGRGVPNIVGRDAAPDVAALL